MPDAAWLSKGPPRPLHSEEQRDNTRVSEYTVVVERAWWRAWVGGHSVLAVVVRKSLLET